MKMRSNGTLLLVVGAAAAGWMASKATSPGRKTAETAKIDFRNNEPVSDMAGRSQAPTHRREQPLPAGLLIRRAERTGLSDIERRSSDLIESMRGKPWFGEWSMKYLAVTDALRADVNHDGWLTSEDFAQFVAWMQQGDTCADFNADGLIDAGDMETFVNAYTREELMDRRRDATPAC